MQVAPHQRSHCSCLLPNPTASDDLHPVLQHSDLSVRNLLVLDEPDGSQPRISGVLDWEFAIAGPAEEEFTFFATMEGLSDSDTHVFQEVLKVRTSGRLQLNTLSCI